MDNHLYSNKIYVTPKKWENAYNIALDNRKFEIENYWKRTTYFWAIITATFVFYSVSITMEERSVFEFQFNDFLPLLAASLGLILSLAWVLTNKGSKFWQENWEAHVDLIGENFSGPIYKTVLFKSNLNGSFREFLLGACPYSVSSINLLVSYFVFFIWLVLWSIAFCPNYIEDYYPIFKGVIALVTFVIILVFLIFGRSSFARMKSKALNKEYSYYFRSKNNFKS